jgi:hypothetical protein
MYCFIFVNLSRFNNLTLILTDNNTILYNNKPDIVRIVVEKKNSVNVAKV